MQRADKCPTSCWLINYSCNCSCHCRDSQYVFADWILWNRIEPKWHNFSPLQREQKKRYLFIKLKILCLFHHFFSFFCLLLLPICFLYKTDQVALKRMNFSSDGWQVQQHLGHHKLTLTWSSQAMRRRRRRKEECVLQSLTWPVKSRTVTVSVTEKDSWKVWL